MTRDEFLARIDRQEDGCWLWRGCILSTGYGQAWIDGQRDNAHRIAYELLVGPISEGLTIDHLCRVRHCVNPDHLEPVTMRENLLRGESPAAHHARKTHCAEGHPLAGENLRVDRRGWRICVTCDRRRKLESYHRCKVAA